MLRAHQHSRRAIAALERVRRPERLLERMQVAVGGETLDGLDRRAVGLDGEHHAALDRDAVVDHRARAAIARIAADVRAREVEVVAEEVHEEAPGLDLALVALAVDGDRDPLRRDRLHQLLPACSTARTASTSARWRRYAAEAWTSSGGSRAAPRTASTTAASSASADTTTGTAATHPSATRARPSETVAAAFAIQVPSLPIVTAAKPSAAPSADGMVTLVRSSSGATAVM